MYQCEKCCELIDSVVCPNCQYDNSEYIKNNNISVYDEFIENNVNSYCFDTELIRKKDTEQKESKPENKKRTKTIIISFIAIFAIVITASCLLHFSNSHEICGTYVNNSNYNVVEESSETIVIKKDGQCSAILHEYMSKSYGEWSKKGNTYYLNFDHTIYIAEFDDSGSLILQPSSPLETIKIFKKESNNQKL